MSVQKRDVRWISGQRYGRKLYLQCLTAAVGIHKHESRFTCIYHGTYARCMKYKIYSTLTFRNLGSVFYFERNVILLFIWYSLVNYRKYIYCIMLQNISFSKCCPFELSIYQIRLKKWITNLAKKLFSINKNKCLLNNRSSF